MRMILCVILFMVSSAGFCQTGDSIFLYRRGSIYSMMIGHRSLAYEQEIEKAFDEMPVPDKYNDHGLGKKVFYTTEEKLRQKGDGHEGFVVNGSSKREDMNDFDFFLQRQHIASRLVAKWFQRKKGDGICNMELVQERGYNNASEVDKRIAALSVRKDALLMDAGEELIGSTFVLINDIRYIDKSRGSSVIGGAISAVLKGSSLLQGNSNALEQKDLGDLIASYKGFNVKIKTYLYQLVWDDDISSFWYNNVYTESKDDSKKEAFENNRGKFSLRYLGMQESSGKDVSFAGINESKPQQMVRKACQRAFDENVANLQKNFEVFKVKAPLRSIQPLTCEIGLKEGITQNSRYEVLETVEDKNGHVEYNRVGVIRPVKDKIWDNRFMAVEEGAENATLGFTTFEKVSGGDFYPGLLLRELK